MCTHTPTYRYMCPDLRCRMYFLPALHSKISLKAALWITPSPRCPKPTSTLPPSRPRSPHCLQEGPTSRVGGLSPWGAGLSGHISPGTHHHTCVFQREHRQDISFGQSVPARSPLWTHPATGTHWGARIDSANHGGRGPPLSPLHTPISGLPKGF